MEPTQETPPSYPPVMPQPASPPVVISHKYRPLVGGIAIALGTGLAVAAGFLLFGNYFTPEEETVIPLVSTKADPMADWKTYTNTQYGFEFRYPTNWRTDSANTGDYITMRSLDNKAVLTIAPENIGRESVFDRSAKTACSITNIQFSSKSAKECISELPNLYSRDIRIIGLPVLWTADNEISGSVTPRDASLEIQLTQILSTFKFIEPTAVVPAECSGRTTTEIGGVVYPEAAKYSNLNGLGAYLTAEDCSATRLAEVVKNQYPRYAEHVVLTRAPSSALIVVLKKIGLAPSPEKCANQSESACTDWRALKEANFVPANLVLLRPFLDFISYTDCYFCG